MSNTVQHPKTDDSLDVGHVSSPAASTPSIHSLFEDPPEGRSIQSSASLPSVPPTANVQFAPLPEINPRDRRSTRPLGMAARSQMLQQRRQIQMQGHSRWLEPDDRPMLYISDEEEEDPLESLGRLIADKSKSLWKRVTSAKAKQSDEGEGETRRTASEAIVDEGERGAVLIPAADERRVPVSSEASEEDHPNQARGNFQKIE